MLKFLKRALLTCIKLYVLYALVTGVIIFALPVTEQTDYEDQIDSERFYADETGVDQVVLLENAHVAALARHDLIANAEHTIDVAYYRLHSDYSAEAFFGALFEAADRGVKVRILIDGAHDLTGRLRDVRYAVLHHDNMELKLYEPPDPLRPWTWNNRLHDKYIIADHSWGIIGGRNIGLRFFDSGNKSAVRDRDVLIINQEGELGTTSVIYQFKDYYEQQWQSSYAQYAKERLGSSVEGMISRGSEKTEEVIEELRAIAQERFEEKLDWQTLAFPTRKITLIYNPMGRLSQEPWILMELGALLEDARERVLMQSPYFIPTRSMRKYLPDSPVDAETIILTNHPASPGYSNISAMAGYLNKKKIVEQSVDQIHEYYDDSRSLHAKTYVFDRRLSLVGSFNFDARSSFLSTESMVVIDSPQFAQHLKTQIKAIISESLPAQAMTAFRAAVLALFRVVWWPFAFLL